MVNLTALLLILMVMFLSCYMLWDSNQVYQAADARNYEAYIPTEKNTKSFEELRKINPDILGWIRVMKQISIILCCRQKMMIPI